MNPAPPWFNISLVLFEILVSRLRSSLEIGLVEDLSSLSSFLFSLNISSFSLNKLLDNSFVKEIEKENWI